MVVIVQYIENAYGRPQNCLDDIINLRQSCVNPYAELDALYLNILSSAKVDRRLLVNILSAALVCGFVAASSLNHSAHDTAKVDRVVESVLLLEPGDVQLALLDLKSLVGLVGPLSIPPSQRKWGKYFDHISYRSIRHIKFRHKSFSDFLFDSTRSKGFYVQSELAHTTVAKGCLNILSDNSKMMEK